MPTDADSHSTHTDDRGERPHLDENPAALPLIQRPEVNWLCVLLTTVLTLGMSIHIIVSNAGSGLPDMGDCKNIGVTPIKECGPDDRPGRRAGG
jgi:hypothetical protein